MPGAAIGAGGIGIFAPGLWTGAPPAAAGVTPFWKARATSESSLDLPVPGGPETSTFRDCVSNLRASRQSEESSVAIAVVLPRYEIFRADNRKSRASLSIQAFAYFFGYRWFPNSGRSQ